MGVSIKDIDNDNASFSEGTLTDVVAVNDGLELANNPALSFDGVDDYVDTGYDLGSNLNTATIECWVENYQGKAETFKIATLFGRSRGGTSNDILIGFNFNNQIEIYQEVGGSNYTTSESYQNELIHIAFIYKDSNEISLYINGNLETTINITESWVTNNLYIGNADYNYDEFFEGLIDEFRIWNTARTQQQIQDNMNKELTGTETGLVAYYKMNEGSGTTLIDSAGTNDGNIIGATWQDNYISWNLDGTGTRQSPQLDLSAVNDVASSSISWQETLNSQTITIETSVDGGSTWQTATNGGAIPNLPANPTTLDVRQILDTNDTTVTPVLESLEVDIDTAEENTDSGSFNIDAENWYTMVWQVFQESSLKENIEHDLDGWIKVDKNTADWNKG